jgi:hypothetical protein
VDDHTLTCFLLYSSYFHDISHFNLECLHQSQKKAAYTVQEAFSRGEDALAISLGNHNSTILMVMGQRCNDELYYLGSNILVVAAPVTMYYGLAGLTYQWSKAAPSSRRWAVIFFYHNLFITPVSGHNFHWPFRTI